jgi:hypothetical protein
MQIRTNFQDFFFEQALPALSIVIKSEFGQYPEFYSKTHNVKTSDRSIEQSTQVSGIGLLSQIGETEHIAMDKPVQGFDKTWKHLKWGLAVPTSQEMVDDDKWGLVVESHQALARSCKETYEIDAASDFNNGFSTSFLGPDGKPLFSATHPLVKSGGAQSNLGPPADLSYTSLQRALTDFETMRDSAGLLHRIQPKYLAVAPANRWTAHEILRSSDRPDTANRATNTLKFALDGLPEPLINPYFTDPDAWFLMVPPSRSKLIWWWRRRPYRKPWFDDGREVGYVGLRYRASHGWGDFNGLYGNAGADE